MQNLEFSCSFCALEPVVSILTARCLNSYDSYDKPTDVD